MSLYNTVVYFPELQSQVLDTEVDSTYADERIKVNEAETLFAEFEACLSGQLMRKFSSIGKNGPTASTQPLDSLISSSNTTATTGSTLAVGRAHPSLSATSMVSDVHTQQLNESLNVDMPNLSELELTASTSTTSNVATPAGMSPRRRSAGRLPPRIIPGFSSHPNCPSVDARIRNQTSLTDALVSPTQLDVRGSSNLTNFSGFMVPISPVLPRSIDPSSVESRQTGTRFLADAEVSVLDD